MDSFSIADFELGINSKPYFIAEIGSNFDGSLSRAKDLIHLAKESGAQAAKFQHYTAGTLVSNLGFKALGSQLSHQKKWAGSVFDVYKAASLNSEWTAELCNECKKIGIHFITSPYSHELVDLVDRYVPAFKIGSGDITWTEIIRAISKKNKPVLLATGASSLEDVTRAIKTIQMYNNKIVLMQCNTNYTEDRANLNFQNLQVLNLYKLLFPHVVLGLSDHTQGDTAVLGAYALGARVFEKHFTDDISRSGPDHHFAMTPQGFRKMVSKTLDLELMMGSPNKIIEPNEVETSIVQRRAIYAAREINVGESLVESDFIFLRPSPAGTIPPYLAESLIGRRVKTAIPEGHAVKWEDIS
ncbi:N-acetylneuraminate synthase family protein [Flavobacterium sp.]|jgi:sialic acid synthase SpsE|uniref:N-acetylneuraminate synthase family protein n=1 Tax=Flavobacterium sp. TaxID=239 RepID=UPI0037C07717